MKQLDEIIDILMILLGCGDSVIEIQSVHYLR